LSRFWLVSRICPGLPISAFICLRIGGQKLDQILSVRKNCWRPRLSPDPLGELKTLAKTPKSNPHGSRYSHPTVLVPDYSAQIMVTLKEMPHLCQYILYVYKECYSSINTIADLSSSRFVHSSETGRAKCTTEATAKTYKVKSMSSVGATKAPAIAWQCPTTS